MTGLYGKYKLEKADGSSIDPKAEYFILRIDNDPAARKAILEYARWSSSNKELYKDLFNWVLSHEPGLIDGLAAHELKTLGIEKPVDPRVEKVLKKWEEMGSPQIYYPDSR